MCIRDSESLVAWSLLRSDVADGDVRLSMLETVREYAVARLESEDRFEDLRRKHAERFLALAFTAESELTGSAHAEWLERLEHELDNIRATLDWCLSSGRVEDALRAMSALGRFWRAHGHASEARRWLSLGLALATGGASAPSTIGFGSAAGVAVAIMTSALLYGMSLQVAFSAVTTVMWFLTPVISIALLAVAGLAEVTTNIIVGATLVIGASIFLHNGGKRPPLLPR